MITARTRVEDYESWRRDTEKIIILFRRGAIDYEKYQVRLGAVWKKYESRVFKEDFHYFEDELKFRHFLRQIRPDPARVEQTVSHE